MEEAENEVIELLPDVLGWALVRYWNAPREPDVAINNQEDIRVLTELEAIIFRRIREGKVETDQRQLGISLLEGDAQVMCVVWICHGANVAPASRRVVTR